MTRVERMVVLAAPVARAMEALVRVARVREWLAPDVTFTPRTAAPLLSVGDRFRLEVLGGIRFEYLVEAMSEREVVFAFEGPWRGRERWSFIADGAETIVRRTYEVERLAPLATLAWRAVGDAVVGAHLAIELSRLREAVERSPGPAAEIAATEPTGAAGEANKPSEATGAAGPAQPASPPPFPVDEG